MATPNHDNKDGAPPREIHVEDKKTNWLAWLALAAGLLALLYYLSTRNRDEDVTPVVTNEIAETNVMDTMTTDPVATDVGYTTGLGAYLGGTDALPRTFAFENLKFDTGKSIVRAADRAELDLVAAALKQYPDSRVRIAGYADARGSGAANAALGKARADGVKTALVASGIDAGRIETASGGETDPVDSNTTSTGQAENRRTELVVTQR